MSRIDRTSDDNKVARTAPAKNLADAAIAAIQRTLDPHFDREFYLTTYPEVRNAGFDPVDHYIRHGASEGRDPHPAFSTQYYIAANPDVEAARINPFLHYVMFGKEQGRKPHPGDADATTGAHSREFVIRTIKPFFDRDFYLRLYPDVRASGVDPVEHYVDTGAEEFRDPHPDFSTAYYALESAGLGEVKQNPYVHYIIQGQKRGLPTRPQPSKQDDANGQFKLIRTTLEPYFDKEFYLLSNPDVKQSGLDPVMHYIRYGVSERRDPNPDFSTEYYLSANPDVAQAGVNPLFHYVVAGKQEGRLPRMPGGFRTQILRVLEPLETRLNAHWMRTQRPLKHALLTAAAIRRHLRKCMQGRDRAAVVSLGHDNYTREMGGVQLCQVIEEAAFRKRDVTYINLYPWQPLPILARETAAEELLLNVMCDGRLLGPASAGEFLAAFDDRALNDVSFALVVHALHGHAPEFVSLLQRKLRAERAFFWIHDYFSICDGYTLLRNEVHFCGAPPVGSAACGICVFGDERPSHASRMRALFENVSFTIVAPSFAALDLWSKRAGLPYDAAIIHEHCKIKTGPQRSKVGRKRKVSNNDRTVKVAYLGYPVPHKGWPVFEELARRLWRDSRYELHHLGQRPQSLPGTKFRAVSTGAAAPADMSTAVAEEKIDVCVLYSIWPETFSFVAHEALAGGAMIVTSANSGNIARLVQELDCGLVFRNEIDLFAAFESGEIANAARARSRRSVQLQFSEMTADLIPSLKSAARATSPVD